MNPIYKKKIINISRYFTAWSRKAMVNQIIKESVRLNIIDNNHYIYGFNDFYKPQRCWYLTWYFPVVGSLYFILTYPMRHRQLQRRMDYKDEA